MRPLPRRARRRFPDGKEAHCKFGYFLERLVGLYLPLRSLRVPIIIDDFLQIVQCLAIFLTSNF